MLDILRILSRLNVPKRYLGADISAFGGPIPGYVESWESLFVSGPRGTGKTHLACAAIKEIVKGMDPELVFQTTPAYFLPVPELMLQFKQSYNQGAKQTEGEILDRYTKIKTLVLDDLGAERVSDWSIQMLYLLIDRRYREFKHTIITTNMSLGDIAEKLDDRISSRIAEMCRPVLFKGEDKRLKKVRS